MSGKIPDHGLEEKAGQPDIWLLPHVEYSRSQLSLGHSQPRERLAPQSLGNVTELNSGAHNKFQHGAGRWDVISCKGSTGEEDTVLLCCAYALLSDAIGRQYGQQSHRHASKHSSTAHSSFSGGIMWHYFSGEKMMTKMNLGNNKKNQPVLVTTPVWLAKRPKCPKKGAGQVGCDCQPLRWRQCTWGMVLTWISLQLDWKLTTR